MAEPQDERYVFLEELLGSAQVPKLVMVDIRPNHRVAPALVALQDEGQRHDLIAMSQGMVIGTQVPIVLDVELADVVANEARWEERRGGERCDRPWRSGGWPVQ